MLELLPAEGELPKDALGAEHHEDDEQCAIQHLANVRGHAAGHSHEAQALGQRDQQYCADHRPGNAPAAADDDDGEYEYGLRHGETRGVYEGDVVRVERAGNSCKRAPDSEYLQLVPHHILAQGLGENLILTNRLQHSPEW